jgi:hypothetical protein
MNSEASATMLEHLGHKGQSIQLSLGIKSVQDLLLAADLNPVTYLQRHLVPL